MSDHPPAGPAPHLTILEMAEIAGGLAHELRNPLSIMMVNLKLLAEDLQDASANFDDVRRRALLKVDVLRGEAQRLQSLFDDFLNLTAPYALQRGDFDLNKIVHRLVEFFEPMLRASRIELRVEASPVPLIGSFDEKLLAQALLNLVVNARDAMPGGGTLTLATGTDGRHALIRVADTGIGISEKDQQRVLRPFFSTKPRGTGLGLSITRRIIQEHSGQLTFTSTPGRGTTFSIHLPLQPRELAAPK